jgi:hypothetical protein
MTVPVELVATDATGAPVAAVKVIVTPASGPRAPMTVVSDRLGVAAFQLPDDVDVVHIRQEATPAACVVGCGTDIVPPGDLGGTLTVPVARLTGRRSRVVLAVQARQAAYDALQELTAILARPLTDTTRTRDALAKQADILTALARAVGQ